MMNQTGCCAILTIQFLFVVIGCGTNKNTPTQIGESPAVLPESLPTKQTRPTFTTDNAPPSAKDVNFKFIADEKHLNIKRSVDVRLESEISEEDLRTLALKIKGMNSTKYERTFICYYLPGMIVDSGAWATTHFNPNLEVRILGAKNGSFVPLPPNPDLLIGDWKFVLENGYANVSGEVTNTTKRPLKGVVAVASFYTGDGIFIKSGEALIAFDPVLAGQTSPFELLTSSNPEMKTAKLTFKFLFGATIPAMNHKEFEAAVADFQSKRKAEADAMFGTGPKLESPLGNDANADRKCWLNCSYNTTIYQIKGNAWEERDHKTSQVKWTLTETARTGEYIELFNATRNQTWRLFPDKMLMKNGEIWVWVSNGNWKVEQIK